MECLSRILSVILILCLLVNAMIVFHFLANVLTFLYLQIRQSGRDDVLLAIRNIPIELVTASLLVEEASATFLAAYKESFPSVEEDSTLLVSVVNAFEVGNQGLRFQDEVQVPSGMSQILQSFCSVLEGLHTILFGKKKIEVKDSIHLRLIIGSLLNVFRSLNDPNLKALLSVEYAKTLVGDTAHHCLAAAKIDDVSILFDNSVEIMNKTVKNDKEKKEKNKKIIEMMKDNETSSFTEKRISSDVKQVLLCLGTARSLQLQKSCLQLLRSLISLSPESVTLSVEVLGALLASPSISSQLLRDNTQSNEKEGLVGEILTTLVSALPKNNNTNNNKKNNNKMEIEGVARTYNFLPQDILQPFCAR